MNRQLPSTISAVRVAKFVSTAAWIQGCTAEEAVLPPDALNNFLRRHGVQQGKRQAPPEQAPPGQQPAPTPPTPEEEESEEDSSIGDEDDDEVSSATGVSGASSDEEDGLPPGVTGAQAELAGNGEALPGATPAIQGPTPLSPGAIAAIVIWSVLGVAGIIGLYFWLRKRKRDKLMQEAADDDEESRGPMAMQAAAPAVIEPVYLRPEGGSRQGSFSGAPPLVEAAYLPPEYAIKREGSFSGSPGDDGAGWVAVPPWQQEQPTWRDSQPFRQSQQPAAVGGLPANPRPNSGSGSLPEYRRPEFDRQTVTTSDRSSTIFAYNG